MTTFVKFSIEPGGLSDADREKIIELAERGVKAWTIARRLRKHPSTVSYFLYRQGLKKLAETRRRPYMRGGKLVLPFSAAEDEFVQEQAIEGVLPGVIAERLRKTFGTIRSRDAISSRLMLLASDETAREDEMEAA